MWSIGKLELAVLQCGTHPVLAFLNFGFGQTNDGETGQALARCTSTVTCAASMPESARLYKTARLIYFFLRFECCHPCFQLGQFFMGT